MLWETLHDSTGITGSQKGGAQFEDFTIADDYYQSMPLVLEHIQYKKNGN